MVRLADLPGGEREHLLALPCHRFEKTPWVRPRALAACRLAIISSAAIQVRGTEAFALRSPEYRVIPADTPEADIVMTHMSVNFDRTGFQHDVNVVFPIARCRELVESGELGSLAAYHYACSGAAIDLDNCEATGRELAGLLAADEVDAAVLVPV